jgi:hypothetical protein
MQDLMNPSLVSASAKPRIGKRQMAPDEIAIGEVDSSSPDILDGVRDVIVDSAKAVDRAAEKAIKVVTEGAEWVTDIPEKIDNVWKEGKKRMSSPVSFSSVSDAASFGQKVISHIIFLFASLMSIMAALATASLVTLFPAAAVLGQTAAPILMGLLSMTLTIITIVAIPLLGLGMKLALVIPMIPVFAWIGVMLDWMVIVIEAMIAAPYWAMAHLEGEGEGMGQRSSHGYIFMLNLLFRPAIVVIVFTMVTTVLGVVVGFANGHFRSIYGAMIKGADLGFFGMAVMLIATLFMAVTIFENLLTKAYSIVSVVPDKVFSWIGGNFGSNVGGNMGAEMASGMNSAADQGASLAASGVKGAAEGGMKASQSVLKKTSRDDYERKQADLNKAQDQIGTSQSSEEDIQKKEIAAKKANQIAARRGNGYGELD